MPLSNMPGPFSPDDMKELVILLWGAVVAALAWTARTLRSAQSFTALQFVGGILGAAVASFAFGALIHTADWLTPVTKLGIAGVVGWVGGDVLAALASQFEKRVGWRITDDRKE